MAAGVADLPQSTSTASCGGARPNRESAGPRVPTAKYTKVGETLRHVIPGHMQCSMACGGRACKYENPARWSESEQAVRGLYSSWITDNLLAMARPSTEIIEKYNIIEQFHRCGVRTVINLQRPGEHASCGNALESESGFTYRPEIFMEAGIYFYNFGWKDYGVASLTTILDMVKVMSFAIQEGKMAVHCHAGLGRTGVLIACFLVFTTRMSADQAILFVRAKRPNSIQTRGQLLCVREFAQFLVPLRTVFACAEPRAHTVTLTQYLTRQRHLLHGYEARRLRHVPKPVQLLCRLLSHVAQNRPASPEQVLDMPDLAAEVEKTVSQQAIQLLGKELIGKGITVAIHRHPLHHMAVSSDLRLATPLQKSRSYSDSDLHLLEALLTWPEDPVTSLEAELLTCSRNTPCFSPCTPLYPRPVWDVPGRRRMLGDIQRSLSLGSASAEKSKPTPREAWQEESGEGEDEAVQTELTPEQRRLLVARALALDLKQDGKEYRGKVLSWQAELNSREGAWERLCGERDAFVLAGLMWSWLEQLKEPVITTEDVETLSGADPLQSLNALEKGPRQTLLCVLQCVAHLHAIPAQLEAAILQRTAKAFTQLEPDDGQTWYADLKAILTVFLDEIRVKATEETEPLCDCMQLP